MLSRRLAQGATLVVDDRLAAIHLEAYVAGAENLLGAAAWQSRDIQTREEWCASLWSANTDRQRLLLSQAQSDALWRKVIKASPASATLIDTARIAMWVREAWELLQDWQLDFRALHARDDDPGFREFLTWAGQYEQILSQSGWLDRSSLGRSVTAALQMNGYGRGGVVWSDLRSVPPVVQSLSSALREAGSNADTWVPESVTESVHRVALEDGQEELHKAIAWACDRLNQTAITRVALVVPTNPENEQTLARWLDPMTEPTSPAYTLMDGQAVSRVPAIGAALDCMTLFSRHADFQVLSRWLRSPFVGNEVESLAVRSLAERDLRSELIAQLDFQTACRSAGLDRWLGERVPLLWRTVGGILDQFGQIPRRQSPTRWASVAQELLSTMGWPGSSASAAVLDAWQKAVDALSLLTPVLGTIDYEQALAEFRAHFARAQLPVRLPLDGITVLSRIEDLGPGYDAAWIMGMSDRVWPRPAQPNPLLPHALQAVQQMPMSTPADAVERCRALTSRLIARVPEIVFSSPRIENQFAAEPSPLLREIEALDVASLPAVRGLYARPLAHTSMETIDDPVPAFSGTSIAGGAGTLATQARCPLRAFIDSRLATRPLQQPERGIGARHRGILVHRALELLLADLPSRASLAALRTGQINARIGECVDRALRERMRGAHRSLGVYAQLERDRLLPLLRMLVAEEVAREDFVVERLEAKATAKIGGIEIDCRIDRVDRLDDSSFAIIDYKTGLRATPADWFKSRLVEPQLPLYVHVIGADVDAIVIGSVRPGAVGYQGLWQSPGTFSGSPYRSRAQLEWPDQRVRWSEQLEELVTEYVRGDSRIFVADLAQAAGPYAPLTRLYEQIALAGTGPEGAGQ